MLKRGALLALLSTAVALSACGGSDDKASKTEASDGGGGAPVQAAPAPTAAAPKITKSRYIARVDRICVAARARLLPLRARTIAAAKLGDPAVVYKRYADLTGQAASVYTGAVGQIRGLGAPPGDQAEIDKLNALFAQTGSITRGLSAAAAAQDAQRIRDLSAQVTTVAEKYRVAAKAYGFRQCGKPAVQSLNRRGNR
jgi:hypothetical protein